MCSLLYIMMLSMEMDCRRFGGKSCGGCKSAGRVRVFRGVEGNEDTIERKRPQNQGMILETSLKCTAIPWEFRHCAGFGGYETPDRAGLPDLGFC